MEEIFFTKMELPSKNVMYSSLKEYRNFISNKIDIYKSKRCKPYGIWYMNNKSCKIKAYFLNIFHLLIFKWIFVLLIEIDICGILLKKTMYLCIIRDIEQKYSKISSSRNYNSVHNEIERIVYYFIISCSYTNYSTQYFNTQFVF